jgi:type II secretion system protein H
MQGPSTAVPRGTSGFSLIEMLSVVAIIALVVGVALPNLGIRSRRAMEDEAKQLAATLEFARQRSVMTAVPHRLMIDVEGGAYWLEWLVSESRALGEDDPAELAVYELENRETVPMAPPRGSEQLYRALSGSLGHTTQIQEIIQIDAIETGGGFLERGLVGIVFERDGTSEPAEILLSDQEGNSMRLELAPVADTVRITHDDR